MFDAIISIFNGFPDDTKIKLFGDFLSSGTQILLVLGASFIFPAAQGFFSARNQKRRDYTIGKEKILRDLTACLPKYLANYSFYVKFCSFMINPQKETYLGLSKEKGSEILIRSMSNMLETQQPEALLESIEAYFFDERIKHQAKRLKDNLNKLSSICFESACVEKECDAINDAIDKEYKILFSLMTHELLSDLKR